jgi:hypothetical protein
MNPSPKRYSSWIHPASARQILVHSSFAGCPAPSIRSILKLQGRPICSNVAVSAEPKLGSEPWRSSSGPPAVGQRGYPTGADRRTHDCYGRQADQPPSWRALGRRVTPTQKSEQVRASLDDWCGRKNARFKIVFVDGNDAGALSPRRRRNGTRCPASKQWERVALPSPIVEGL